MKVVCQYPQAYINQNMQQKQLDQRQKSIQLPQSETFHKVSSKNILQKDKLSLFTKPHIRLESQITSILNNVQQHNLSSQEHKTHDNPSFEVNIKLLWQLVRSCSTHNGIGNVEFNIIFLALGFLNYAEYLQYLQLLSGYNQRFEELKQQKKIVKKLSTVHDDVSIASWSWDLFSLAVINDDHISQELVFEVLTNLLDLSICPQSAEDNIKQIVKYYYEIAKKQIGNRLGQTSILQRKESKNTLDPYFENLSSVILYCRDFFRSHNSCTIYGMRLGRNNKVTEQYVSSTSQNEIQAKDNQEGSQKTIFEKLFQHSRSLQNRKKLYQYQRDLQDLKGCTFSPERITRKYSKSPSVSIEKKKTSRSPKLSEKKSKFQDTKQMLKNLRDNFINRSPTQVDSFTRKVSAKKIENKEKQIILPVSTIRGVSDMVDRLQKGRELQFKKEHLWDELLLKQRRIAERSKSVTPFDFEIHRTPHPKPLLFVDVETSTGKQQRIGLFGGDNIDEVAFNFGKAHSLNQKQVQALKLRLLQVVKKYL